LLLCGQGGGGRPGNLTIITEPELQFGEDVVVTA
jgi:hypothetical protein